MNTSNELALTLTLSPRRGKSQFPRGKTSLSGGRSEAFEMFSLSRGERGGVRASVALGRIN